VLVVAAGIPRIVGAFLIRKEPFGDAYCYIEQAVATRAKIVAGTFSINDLYGFWLPLYQFFCSIISLVVNQPVYVGRLVSAVAGIGVCVLVYCCSYILTSSQRLSLIVALAIALNPFHLQYSSAAMTDIPHALMVLGCLYFVLTERWTLAACAGAAACLIRLDSWMLIALVPTIQLVRRRKLPILSPLILASAPAFWLIVCWRATGSPLASFHAHDYYVLLRLTAHPELNKITLARTWVDAYSLVYAANVAVLSGCFAAVWLLFQKWRKGAADTSPAKLKDLLICLLFFFGYVGFISTAYLTKNQSDIWPRYGLLHFAIGLPILAYSMQQVLNSSSALAKVGLAVVLALGLMQYKKQADDLASFWGTPERSRAIASYLKQEYAADPSIKVYCDHPEVRVVSGIPRSQFYDSYSNGGAPRDRKGFLEFLRTRGITFLMIPQESEGSTPRQLFPNLMKDPVVGFEDVIPAADSAADSLYRVRIEKLPPSGGD